MRIKWSHSRYFFNKTLLGKIYCACVAPSILSRPCWKIISGVRTKDVEGIKKTHTFTIFFEIRFRKVSSNGKHVEVNVLNASGSILKKINVQFRVNVLVDKYSFNHDTLRV